MIFTRYFVFVAYSFIYVSGASALELPDPTSLDVLSTQRYVPPSPAAGMVGSGICSFGVLGSPLSLQETIERALCENPKTRDAWVGVKQSAAGLGQARAAYLPNVVANWQGVRDDSTTNVLDHPNLSSRDREFVRTDGVSLTWVLYDFGGREAALANARELLSAAQANELAVLQTVFVQTAKDYYAAQAAQGALVADIEIEESAKRTFTAVNIRMANGAAPMSDVLQAQTAFSQAVINRVKASADAKVALGNLAVDMALSPSTLVSMPGIESGVEAGPEFSASVDELIRVAKDSHPAVLAARAEVNAADAKVQQTRDAGYPTISYVAKYSHNNQPASLGLGIPEYPAVGHDYYAGIQVSIPIFEGLTRTYSIRAAAAQAEDQQVHLADTQQKVALEVWTAYQSLQESTDNLPNSATLLDVANAALTATQKRYQAGVGSLLDVLTAQGALANAKRQRIQSLTDWRSDRLRLAGSLGHLDATALQATQVQ